MKYQFFFISMILIAAPVLAELPAGHPPLPGAKQGDETKPVNLPNLGRVLTVLQSGGYTYIEVDKSGSKEWLAVPHMELKAGEQIRYSKGVVMKDFHSKTLKRTFDNILFVGNIKRVEE